MEENSTVDSKEITKKFLDPANTAKLLLSVTLAAVILGTLTGLIISQKGGSLKSPGTSGNSTASAKDPTQDSKTFKDFAEGTIKIKPTPSNGEYTEGTHTLIRQGAVPVALTSSVVDLTQYENKKVKVFGETQKALKEGWLMDVGKVEEVK